jgi:hypothetical protein
MLLSISAVVLRVVRTVIDPMTTTATGAPIKRMVLRSFDADPGMSG